jgi:two-component sensor histidine kinase
LNDLSISIIPANEPQRIAAVRRFDILDTPPDGFFDRVTAIAARRFDVPISIISIVDHDRIWFKSHHGLDVEQIGRDAGLCASAILTPDPHILPDAKLDPRSLANPLVAGEFGLRFYVGVPLTTVDGFNLGTLCVIDKVPRPIDQRQIDDLKDLATVVMDQMELRLSARRSLAHAHLMAREIDHRVMNSLQFVSSLLAMQSRQPGAAAAAEQLQAAANRVAAVAQVHRNFYVDDAVDASCIAFLRRLCGDLAGILVREIVVQGDEGRIPTTRIQPLGLIVNELVTNAAKHGAGTIRVTYRIMADRHELSVSDEGAGLPAGFDPTRSEGLGMKILMSLVAQLGASVSVGSGSAAKGGACYTVTSPA